MLKELNDGTSYIKATYWKGEDLEGIWLATYKIDGIRCIRGKDNKIYLDERIISPEHPIHEYTHLWDRVVAKRNPKLWKRGIELMKKTSLWE